MRNGLLALLSLPLAACSLWLPRQENLPEAAEWVQVLEHSCTVQPTEDTLRASVGDGPRLDFVRRISRVETALARRPLVGGNTVTLLKDGPDTHAAQLAAIASARHHVHLDVYLLTDDDVGQRYAVALGQKAREGVKVRLAFDGLGGLGAGSSFRERLKDAGVQLAEFNTLNPLKDPRLWRITRRNHRKLLVVDGHTAFTGGINITDDYSSPSLSPGSTGGGWRDTHIRIEGPGVAEFQRLFIENWERLKGPMPPAAEYWPRIAPGGHKMVRAVTDHGEDLLETLLGPAKTVWRVLRGKDARQDHRIYGTYLAAIREARSRVWITQAYFAPNREFVDALSDAARRGVDVRLLMPGKSDVGLMVTAARGSYQTLLDAGLRLYEYDSAMIHAKTAVIDGVWSTVGSSNLDFRSFIFNDEANAIVIGRAFGAQMEQMFEDDLAQARPIVAADWAQRPVLDRHKERLTALIKPVI